MISRSIRTRFNDCKAVITNYTIWRSQTQAQRHSSVTGGSSVARGGGGGAIAPHWHVEQNAEWEKHYVLSTFETVLCTGVDKIVI